MAAFDPDAQYHPGSVDVRVPEAWEADPVVVGVILGPHGETLRVVTPRRQPFGFQSRRR